MVLAISPICYLDAELIDRTKYKALFGVDPVSAPGLAACGELGGMVCRTGNALRYRRGFLRGRGALGSCASKNPGKMNSGFGTLACPEMVIVRKIRE